MISYLKRIELKIKVFNQFYMLFKYLGLPLYLIVLMSSCSNLDTRTKPKSKQEQIVDSIFALEHKKNTVEQRIGLLKTLPGLINEVDIDTTRNNYYNLLAYRFFKLRDFKNFNTYNFKSIRLSKEIDDKAKLALNYWDRGNYHGDYKYTIDSAYYYYYQAQKIYEEINDEFDSGMMWLNMAIAQENGKDYIGSEHSVIQAIPIFINLKAYPQLYQSYSLLGVISGNLEYYDQAIFNHKKALEYYKKTQNANEVQEAPIYNNIGIVYKSKENYSKAIEYYNLALEKDSLPYKDSRLYALLLDNLAYAKFKNKDYSGLPEMFYTSLKIRDSLSIRSAVPTNKIHLSEYYLSQGDTLLSKRYADDAYALAKKSNNSRDRLLSLRQLADIDPGNAGQYTKEYITINDSLQKKERRLSNRFARIRFETDQFIDKNKEINRQKYWISAALASVLVFGFMLYIINAQRARNRILEFERMQKDANEEIYNLILSQQSKLEEGRQKEKKRISEELHDGILGRLFGTRLSLGSLNDKNDNDSKRMRNVYIDELKSIEEEVRNISHELGDQTLDSDVSYLTLLSKYLDQQSLVGGFKYMIDADPNIEWDHLSGNIKINIYRIIQEAVQNINKYAKATTVYFNFEKISNIFQLIVEDNGIGFDLSVKKKGIGLKNINSRVRNMSGSVTIESQLNKGTKLTVEIPLKTKQVYEEKVESVNS